MLAMDFELARSVDLLRRTPEVLRSLLSGASEDWLKGTEGPETWSPYDVVGHLIHGEKTDWIPRLKILLESGEARPFEKFDRRAQFKASRGRSIEELLDEFEALRKENLRALEKTKVTASRFAKTGTHPELGRVTLAQLLATWVVHDLDHIGQIARVMAKQYTAAVGPWKAYLSILTDRT
jgi:hypothetical protein